MSYQKQCNIETLLLGKANWMSNHLSNVRGGSHDPFSVSIPAIVSPERLKQKSPNFVYQ